jgi:hypothetical protein
MAAQAVGWHDTIMQMPNQYKTVVISDAGLTGPRDAAAVLQSNAHQPGCSKQDLSCFGHQLHQTTGRTGSDECLPSEKPEEIINAEIVPTTSLQTSMQPGSLLQHVRGGSGSPSVQDAGTASPGNYTELRRLCPSDTHLLALAHREYLALKLQKQQEKIDSNWHAQHPTRPLGTVPDFSRHQAAFESRLVSRMTRRITLPDEFEFKLGSRRARLARREAVASRRQRFVQDWVTHDCQARAYHCSLLAVG